MADFLLIHGAWHGAWCWSRVASRLRAAGHRTHAISLTGLGDRAHLLTREVGLSVHIQDVVAYLEAEELTDVVLVGHSYGGMVITGAADRARRHLGRIVYLDAMVPNDGDCAFDIIAPPERAAGMREAAASIGEGWRIPPPPADLFGPETEADRAWVERRMVAQPLACFTEPVRLDHPPANGLPRQYIYCAIRPLGSFDRYRTSLADDPSWDFHVLETGHDAMVTAPDQVADLLLAGQS